MVSLKSKHDIEIMREACRITGETLNAVEEIIKPGITTKAMSVCKPIAIANLVLITHHHFGRRA